MSLEELLRIDVGALPREEIPELLGVLAALDARLRLRLMAMEPREAPKRKESDGRLLTPEEAADAARVEVKWLLRATRGLPFRRQPTMKTIRFERAGFRDWLAGRRQ